MRRNPNQLLVGISLDMVCLALAIGLSSWLRLTLPFGRYLPDVTQEFPLLVEALFIYPMVFLLLSLYDPDRSFSEADEFIALVTACAFAGLALAGLIYFSIREISRLLLIYFYGLHFILVAAWRLLWILFRNRRRVVGLRKVVIIGSGNLARQIRENLIRSAPRQFELVGTLYESYAHNPQVPDLPCLGGVDQTLQIVREHQIDDVLIAMDGESLDKVRPVVTSLVETSCNVWLAPDYYSLLVYGGQIRDWGGFTLISLKAPTLTGYQRLLKRIFDLVIGCMLLVLLLPILFLIGLMICLDSPGGAILKQERVGENRRLFHMYKFRTMVPDAQEREKEIMRIDDNGTMIHKFPNDPRVTRIGKWLRRTSIDELPQLWNVIKGEMSLVGPRPELPMLVAQYEPWQQKRFAVPQGITGWWQVNGRSDRPMHMHTEDDLYYVQHYSIFLDIKILLKTIWVVLRGDGAF